MDYKTVWLRVEAMVLRLLEQHGETRNSIGPKLGLDRNYLRRYLLTEDQRQSDGPVKPAFDLAFQVADFFGIQPTSLLAPFASDAPETLLMIFPSEPEKNVDKTTLNAIRSLSERVLEQTGSVSSLNQSNELAEVRSELQELEERRDFESEAVAETCKRELVKVADSAGILGLVESIRAVGFIGIWASVQRRRHRLFQAWEALKCGLPMARRIGDQSLYANFLQRSAYYFHSLEARPLSVALLREASERYRADGNETGAACTLVDRAVMAANECQIEYAERLYRAGFELLPSGSSPVYRATAAQGIATCRDLQGDLKGALYFLNRAVSEPCFENERLQAHLRFTSANIQRRLGKFEEAEKMYWAALKTFREFNDADTVLRLCLDLSVCLIQSGERRRLHAVKTAVREQLPKLRNQRALQHQCELLLRELSSEEVGLGQLSKVAENLKKTRPSD